MIAGAHGARPADASPEAPGDAPPSHAPASEQGFSPDWLRLREPFDTVARDAAIASLGAPCLRDWLGVARGDGVDGGGTLEVLDLGAGTGANLRYLAPRLGGRQRWRLLDHDPALLAALPARLAEWAAGGGHDLVAEGSGWRIEGGADRARGFSVQVQSERVDLAKDLASVSWPAGGLVTASALLDLAGAELLDTLVSLCLRAGSAQWWGLNVDGRTQWQPVDPADEAVHALFCAHQRRDKGLGGPALGPLAADFALQRLRAAGRQGIPVESDWCIEGASPGGCAITRAMIEGMAAAATEQAPLERAPIAAWATRRLALLADARLRIGHVELIVPR